MNSEINRHRVAGPASITRLPTEENRLLRLVDKGEETLLSVLLLTMILLACTQIVLRTFFSSGLLWADPFLRYLVLWCGLLGAVTATGQGKHIALDLSGNRISKKLSSYITLVAHLFSTCTAAGLTWAAWIFIEGEIEYGGPGPLAIPLWGWNIIFPVSFGLITLKYLLLLLLQLRTLFFTPGNRANS
jgi:TRAP-type C4-dicarboxylate transport system permease small subunit